MNGKRAENHPISEPRGAERPFLGKRMIFIILVVAGFGTATLFYAGRIIGQAPEAPAMTERMAPMFVTKPNSAANPGIPPIDLSAPGKIETATFALG